MTPLDIDLPYMHLPWWGGGRSVHSPEVGMTFVRLFMITLATDLVQQFYTY
jgi:hypothetical protein